MQGVLQQQRLLSHGRLGHSSGARPTSSPLTVCQNAQMETRLGALLAGRTCVVYDSDADRSSPAWQGAPLRAALQPALGQLLEGRVQPLRHYLHPLRCVLPQLGPAIRPVAKPECLTFVSRWVKTAAELALLRKSAAISAEAMARCIRLTRANVSEAVLAATFGTCAFSFSNSRPGRRPR